VSYSEEELWRLLAEARRMPHGAGQIALTEQVIQHADAVGPDALRFAARMMGTTAYVYGGEPAKSFVTFSWCLAEYDRNPAGYDADDEFTLLWDFKAIVGALTRFPEIPLARTYAVLDDMERRYRAGGHSMHAVYARRWRVAAHIGDAEAAGRWYDRWCAAPRDALSDCVGCDPASKVEYLTSLGRDAEAVALAEPVLAGQLICTEQPQSILTELLVPYLRTGRLAEAADAHRRAYRAVRATLADLAQIADHVAFCALTGNEARGLEIVERHLDWLDRAPSPSDALAFAGSAALLLRRLADGGHGDLPVRRRAGAGRPAGDVRVAALSAELADLALGLAARFDERDGTDHLSTSTRAKLAAEPIVALLPLSAVDRAVQQRLVDQPAVVAGPDTGVSAVPGIDALAPSADLDADALLDLAERHLRLHRRDLATAAWQAFDERIPEPTAAQRTRRLDGQGLAAAANRRRDEAEQAWRAAVGGYADLGDGTREAVAMGRLGAAIGYDPDRVEEALALLTESARRLADDPDAQRRVGAQLRLEGTLGQAGRFDEALAAADRAAEAAVARAGDIPISPEDDALIRAEVDSRRAHCLLMLERHAEAATAANAAREGYAVLGDPPAVAVPCLVHGHVLGDLGELADAIDAFTAALRLARDPELLTAARAARGRVLLGAARYGEAVEDLVEAIACYVAQGDEAQAAFLRHDLALAYHRGGQLLDAAEIGEQGVTTLDRLGAQDAADRTRYLLAQIYRDLDEPDAALAQLTQLATNLDGYDNLPARGQMHEEAAQILYQYDRDAEAARRFAAAADAFAAAGLTLDELRARRWRALALRWADDSEASLAALAQADALGETLPPHQPEVIWERAMLAYDGARVHTGADQPEEALARIVGVSAAFRSIEAFSEALHADLLHGELLLRSERAAEAESVLRTVLGGAPHDSPARENAAWLLSEALELLDREDEAKALRREYGLDE